MRMFTLLPIIAVTCLAAGRPTRAEVDADLRAYAGLLRQIDTGQVDRAMAGLEALARSADNPALRNTATILHRQLTGRSADRLSAFRQRKFADVVVLVPDERSLFEAIQLWEKDAIFPVLIDDAWFAPMFIASYQPKRVVRWRSKDRGAVTPKQIAHWGLRHKTTVDNPPGMVIIEPDSPQRIAGVALAAAYGQPIALVDSPAPLKSPLTAQQAKLMCSQVLFHLTQNNVGGFDYWIALTLAGDYPYRYKVPAKQGYLSALDDLLGHHEGELRYGVCGRLTGDTTMANYQAMASLFLTPRRALMFDGYATRGANFRPWALRTPAQLLRPRFDITLVNDSNTTPDRFAELTRGPRRYDMIWLNTSGMVDHFDLSGRAFPEHLPIGHAAAVHMIHSYSLQSPWDVNTVGGRLLHGGAYWHLGSMHEPYLTAFVTPTAAAARAKRGTPVAFAVRQPPHLPDSKPWKLMVVGDPLWSWRDKPAERVAGTPPEGAELVVYDAEAPPIDRLRAALALGRAVEVELLETLAAQADQLTADQLARVAYLLQRQGRSDLIAGLDADLVKAHPIALAVARDHAIERFDAQIEAGQHLEATRSLPRLVRFLTNTARLEYRLKRWVGVMNSVGQGPRARRMLTALRDHEKTPPRSRTALINALKIEQGNAQAP